MKKINLNIHMFIFLNLIAITIFNDIIIYLTNIEYNFSLLFSTILVCIFSVLIFKKNIQIQKDIDKSDIIPIIAIILLSIFKLLTIDDFIDTLTYHLYNQIHPFIDKINFDFLPSSTFFFPLGDRINYIFVNFLGIRFGTILSCYIVIILYYQFKNILKIFVPKLSSILRTIFFLLILMSNSVAIYMGSYFIDSFSSILLFELVYIFAQNINLLKNKKYLYLSMFILGCLVGIKITNLYLGIIVIAVLLLRNIKEDGLKQIKNIRFYDYILLICITVIPFIIYVINNYIQTGNPVFPLLNNIFNSVYYKDITGADSRLGPKNFLEFIFWPIYICFKMIKGNDIIGIIECTWGVGYILTIYTLCTYKKHNEEFRWHSILTIILTFIWTKFIFGYVRYGLVISYCFYIITIYYLDKEFYNIKKFFSKKSKDPIKLFMVDSKIIIMIILFLLYLSSTIGYFSYYYNVVIDSNIESDYKSNTNISIPYDIDGIWLSTRYNNYYTDLIRKKDDPMYNLDIITPLDPMCKLESGYSEYAQELFKEKVENKTLYMAAPLNYGQYIKDLLKINNMEIVKTIGIYKDNKYLNPYNCIFIIQVDFKTN